MTNERCSLVGPFGTTLYGRDLGYTWMDFACLWPIERTNIGGVFSCDIFEIYQIGNSAIFLNIFRLCHVIIGAGLYGPELSYLSLDFVCMLHI